MPSSGRAATARLTFGVGPASAKGSLAEQVRRSLDQLWKTHGPARIVKVRAFVVSSADATKVPGLVAEAFTKKKRAVPVVSVIRVGALENPAAQVVLETVAEAANAQNPNGIVFVSGQLTSAPKAPNPAAAPLAEKSLASLKTALAGMQVEPAAVLRVTCFASTLVDQAQVRGMMKAQYANAALNLMQIQKDAETQEVECEAVARLSKAPSAPVQLVNPTNAAFAQAALVNAPEVIFSTTFTAADSDDSVRGAFRKVADTMTAAGGSMDSVFYAYAYPSNAAALQKYRNLRFEFFKRDRAPASTNLVFEGVMAPADTLGMDVIAVPEAPWTTLFDGTSLANWDRIGNANWALKGGVVEANAGQGFLLSKNSYRDFELRAELWVDGPANSGVFLRCSNRGEVTQDNAYEVNVYDNRPDQTYATGSIVGIASSSQVMKAADKWNTFEIRAEGDHIVVTLNGVKTVDTRNAKYAEGPVALQASAGTVRFRRVEIRPLGR